MTAQGDLLFGTVPMLEWDGIKLVERKLLAIVLLIRHIPFLCVYVA